MSAALLLMYTAFEGMLGAYGSLKEDGGKNVVQADINNVDLDVDLNVIGAPRWSI
jgi:hypothetical protein